MASVPPGKPYAVYVTRTISFSQAEALMKSSTVDARGQVCPKPLILTKKALNETADGGRLTVLIDNDTSRQNVERFLRDNGMTVETSEEGGVFTLHVTKTRRQLSHPQAEAYCTTQPRTPHAVCIKSDRMGFGDDELGSILIKAFVNTIAETEPLPGTIILYNSGINLALTDSPVLDALKELEQSGVKILVCGTCADYFGKKDQVAVGIVSNMYDISQALASASHVVYP